MREAWAILDTRLRINDIEGCDGSTKVNSDEIAEGDKSDGIAVIVSLDVNSNEQNLFGETV